MLIQLYFESEVPIYLQLRNQIVRGIASGALQLGESLPTVRQMADDASINPMTVNKAYGLLKREGFIVIDRRHGAKVSDSFPRKTDFTPAMEEELALLVCEAKLSGLSEEAIVKKVRQVYGQLEDQ